MQAPEIQVLLWSLLVHPSPPELLPLPLMAPPQGFLRAGVLTLLRSSMEPPPFLGPKRLYLRTTSLTTNSDLSLHPSFPPGLLVQVLRAQPQK